MKKHIYTCGHCWTIYDPTQGGCPVCGRHPHLDNDECDHDCDECSSVLFPPKDGHLDLFQPAQAKRWKRVVPSGGRKSDRR